MISVETAKARVLRLAPAGGGRLVYFAHSKRDYHSARAARAFEVVRAARPGGRVLNPSGFIELWPVLVAALGSQEAVYRLVVELCTEVFALEHEGHIGRGVFAELVEAERLGLPRWVVRDEKVFPVAGVTTVDTTDYKVRYGRVMLDGGCARAFK